MRALRSRWTFVALVPAFFLAGFGIVSAFADGSDSPAPQAVRTNPTAGVATTPAAASGTEPATTAAGPTTSRVTSSQDTGAAPPPGTVAVDYGRWDGIFRVAEAHVVRTYGASTITGRFGYAGGAGCPVKDVVMTGYFYGREGASVGEALWRSSWSGATRVTPGRQLPLEAYGMVAGRAASARLSIARVVCA